MNAIDIIKNYLSGSISAKMFQHELYHNKEMEDLLSEKIQILPYTKSGNSFLYLIENDILSVQGELDSKDLLSQFLTQKGINFDFDSLHEEQFDILLKVQPSWLDLSSDYLKFLLEKHKDKSKRALENALKSEISSNFKFLRKKPKWLQSPQWPIENNTPLFFIEQIDISDMRHDTSYIYVFFNKDNGTYKIIEQSM